MKRAGLSDYLRAAFSARPLGMWAPPNWLGLAAFGILGLLSPGFWVIGAGLELGYLYTLATNRRFQRVVDGQRMLDAQRGWRRRVEGIVLGLPEEDRARYRLLERRCRTILEQQDGAEDPAGLQAQGEGLGRLAWIYLKLLLTRRSLERVLAESKSGEGAQLDGRMEKLKKQLEAAGLGENLKKSLESQLDILQQRVEKQREAREKLAFLEAELTRIQEQAELIREQAVLSTDPGAVSQRIDQIAATLGGTTQWIQEQQQLYGKVEDLLSEPQPMLVPAASAAAKESQ